MALALLTLRDAEGDRIFFDVDLGSNRFFTWSVGDTDARARMHGVEVLDHPRFESKLQGPLPDSALGRTSFAVPRSVFAAKEPHEHPAIQLFSFRTAERVGPAISEIVPVRAIGGTAPELPDLPDLGFALEAVNARLPMHSTSVPMKYREHAHMSSAMFFGALTGFLNNILPQVVPVLDKVGPVLKGLVGGDSGAPRSITNDELMKAFNELLDKLAEASKTPAKQQAVAQALARGMRRPPMAHATMIPPQLLQLFMNPEAIKAIGGVVNDTLKIADQSDQAFKQHLRELIKGVDDPALDKLLESMSLSLDAHSEIGFTKVPQVAVSLDKLPSELVAGTPRTLVRHGVDLVLPVRVDTPKPIGKAKLLVKVKDAITLDVVARQKFELDGVTGGLVQPAPRLTAAMLAKTQPGRDYHVCVTLVWKGTKGQRLGSGMMQRLRFMAEYVFDRVEESGEPIALSDVERHRAFWNKVWQETFTQETRRYELDVKYYFVLEPDRDVPARIEPAIDTTHGALWKEAGRLKAGLTLSLSSLNALLPTISSNPMLDATQLAALGSTEFVTRFHSAARQKCEFKGSVGDSVALWVYPEVKLQRVILKKAATIDERGFVTRLDEQPVTFPLPVLAHFVGTSSKGAE